MARPIQRGKRKDSKPKVKKTTDKSITNKGENQNVNQITIKIEHPTPPKPKKRKPKKKDTPKEEAIDELKEELKNYNEIQTEAGQLGITLPAELGVSPNDASSMKTIEDIKKFIAVIKEKEAKIIEIVKSRKQQPQQPQIAMPSPNRFSPVPSISRAGLPPPMIDPAQPPQAQGQAQVTPSGQSAEIDRELDEIEKENNETPEIQLFNQKNIQLAKIIATIKGNIETARAVTGGMLSPSQLDTFVTQYENAMTRYNTQFSELSKEGQATHLAQKNELFNEISAERKSLMDEKRARESGLPAPRPKSIKEIWNPTNKSGMAMVREYIRLDLDKFRSTPEQVTTMITALRTLTNPSLSEEFYVEIKTEGDEKKSQKDIKETLESRIKDDTLLREATEAEKRKAIAEKAMEMMEEVDADAEAKKQAMKRLRKWIAGESVRKGYVNWGDQIKKDMKTVGATTPDINRIGNMKTPKQKKKATELYLNVYLSPYSPNPPPPKSTPDPELAPTKVKTEKEKKKETLEEASSMSSASRRMVAPAPPPKFFKSAF
jgi:hypothetical protein